MIDFFCKAEDSEVWAATRADTAKIAAEQYTAWRDRVNLEYPPETLVEVRHRDGMIERFNVTLRPEPTYTARKVK